MNALLAGLLLAALAWGGFAQYQLSSAEGELQDVVRENAIAFSRQQATYDAERKRRDIETSGVMRDLSTREQDARSSAAADADAVVRLQRALAKASATARVPGTGIATSPAASSPTGAGLAGVTGSCVSRLAQLAAVARIAYSRALACEGHADALTR